LRRGSDRVVLVGTWHLSTTKQNRLLARHGDEATVINVEIQWIGLPSPAVTWRTCAYTWLGLALGKPLP